MGNRKLRIDRTRRAFISQQTGAQFFYQRDYSHEQNNVKELTLSLGTSPCMLFSSLLAALNSSLVFLLISSFKFASRAGVMGIEWG